MGIMVYSLLWVMQDLYRQPLEPQSCGGRFCSSFGVQGFRGWEQRIQDLGFKAAWIVYNCELLLQCIFRPLS